MLIEVTNVRQINGEPRRRWFTNEYFDLYVWLDEGDDIVGFQLCYEKLANERSLTWMREFGYTHDRIDEGDKPGRLKGTPIVVKNGHFDHEKIANIFNKESREIEDRISRFVYEKILKYPSDIMVSTKAEQR